MCKHEDGVLVAYGVDQRGEWESVECIECGQMQMLRGKERIMMVNGYEVGQEPTREEFATYRKVQAFLQRETAAQYLEGKRQLPQWEFENFVGEFADLEADQGEEEYDNLELAWKYLTEPVFYYDPWDE